MSGRRPITVGGMNWRYRVGKHYCVAKAEDTGEGRKISLADLTGMSWSDVDRGQWKRWFHVTPKQVADWLARPNASNSRAAESGPVQ